MTVSGVKWLGAVAVLATMASGPVAHANLIVNGGFEASSSQTATPTGWTQIGHSDGVIAYSQFGTPVYEGLNFYDFGGFGDPAGPVGDGLTQTVATAPGTLYTLNFGLSSENNGGVSILHVSIGSAVADFNLSTDGTGAFKQPFTAEAINFLATNTSTVISFTESFNTTGADDPLIDGVSFDVAAAGPTGVPEPATIALFGAGLAGLGALRRRRNARRRGIVFLKRTGV